MISSVLDNKRRLVIKTAKELAGANYEDSEYSPRFRKVWPNVNQFVGRNWPNFLEMAHTILSSMLSPDYKAISDKEKEEIFEALQADHEHSLKHRSTRIGQGVPLLLRPDQPGTLERKVFHSN